MKDIIALVRDEFPVVADRMESEEAGVFVHIYEDGSWAAVQWTKDGRAGYLIGPATAFLPPWAERARGAAQ